MNKFLLLGAGLQAGLGQCLGHWALQAGARVRPGSCGHRWPVLPGSSCYALPPTSTLDVSLLERLHQTQCFGFSLWTILPLLPCNRAKHHSDCPPWALGHICWSPEPALLPNPADLCTSPLVASSIMMTTSAVRATAITCRPRPFPGQAERTWSHRDRGKTHMTQPSPQHLRLLGLTDLPSASPQAMIPLVFC